MANNNEMSQAAQRTGKVKRSAVPIPTRVSEAHLRKVRYDQMLLGYKTLRPYLERLIESGLPYSDSLEDDAPLGTFASAVPAVLPAVLGNRCVVALEALTKRILAGEDVGELLAEVRGLRRDIVDVLAGQRTSYDAEMDRRRSASYDGRG